MRSAACRAVGGARGDDRAQARGVVGIAQTGDDDVGGIRSLLEDADHARVERGDLPGPRAAQRFVVPRVPRVRLPRGVRGGARVDERERARIEDLLVLLIRRGAGRVRDQARRRGPGLHMPLFSAAAYARSTAVGYCAPVGILRGAGEDTRIRVVSGARVRREDPVEVLEGGGPGRDRRAGGDVGVVGDIGVHRRFGGVGILGVRGLGGGIRDGVDHPRARGVGEQRTEPVRGEVDAVHPCTGAEAQPARSGAGRGRQCADGEVRGCAVLHHRPEVRRALRSDVRQCETGCADHDDAGRCV